MSFYFNKNSALNKKKSKTRFSPTGPHSFTCIPKLKDFHGKSRELSLFKKYNEKIDFSNLLSGHMGISRLICMNLIPLNMP